MPNNVCSHFWQLQLCLIMLQLDIPQNVAFGPMGNKTSTPRGRSTIKSTASRLLEENRGGVADRP